MEFNLVNLLLVMIIAWVAGVLATRLGFPSVLGELAAGIVFGPPLLGWVEGGHGLHVLAEVGVFLMMLYIGMEIDYRDILKASWPGLMAATGGFVVPFAVGYFVTTRFLDFSIPGGLFLGLAMGVTSLATKSRILADLQLFGTRVANVLIAAALVCDTLALICFAVIMGLADGESLQFARVLPVALKGLTFFSVAIFVGMRVFPLLWQWMRRFGFTERTANFTMVVMVGLVFAVLAEMAGLHSILGAFLAGMFLRSEVLMRKISIEVTTLVHDVSLGFLAPIFFFTAGFEVDFSVFGTHLIPLLVVVATAMVSKIAGTSLFYLFSGFGWREGLAISFGMNGRGAVEIVVAAAALQAGLIDQNVFSILVFMAFITTASVPVLMKFSVEHLRRRGELARADAQRSGILIVGAMPLARLMARQLSGDEDVLIIDSNASRCATAEREGIRAMQGNAIREETLDVAGAAGARLFVAMTSNPEVNSLAADMASNLFGVPEVHVLLEQDREAPQNGEGKDARVPHVLYGGPCPHPLWNSWIAQREIRVARIPVRAAEPAAGFFSAIGDRHAALPLVVERGEQRLMANVAEKLEEGDTVVVLEHAPEKESATDYFEGLVERAPILDIDEALHLEPFFRQVAERLAERVATTEEAIYELLVQRERDSSTVIVPGVAIPHIMVEGEHVTEMVIARSRGGVTFWGEESEARIIFVIAGSRDERKVHLRILSAIAQLFQDASFEQRWMEAATGEDLRQVILATERRRF